MSEAVERHWPALLVASAALGIAAANAARAPALALFALGAVLAACLNERVRLAALAATLLLAGWCWGSLRLDALDRSPLTAEIGRVAAAEVVITGPARRGTYALRIPAQIRRFRGERLRERVLLELPLGRAPPQGAVLELVARVASPHGSRAGGFDERRWLERQGIHVVVHGRDWRIVGRRGGVGGLADRLRRHLARSVAPGLTGERRAVLEGIVLGEDGGLSDELRDAFRASGLYHLLAVSGQNIALIVAAVMSLAWLLAVPRLAAELAALAAIGGYVLAVGWQPSVVRAGVAGGLASLAWLAARPRDRWHFLALGALVLLAWSPETLLEPGFQLSFGAVAAIFAGLPRVGRVLDGYPMPTQVRDALAVSTLCGAVTAPVLWLQFHAIPVYGVLANVLAFAAMGPLLLLGLVGALLEPVLPGAALALAWVNGWCAAYLVGCARLVASLPGAQVTSGTGLAVLAALAAGAAIVLRLPRRRRRAVLATAAALLAVAATWQLLPRAPLPPPTGLRITFLDVGQGDGALLQVPEGAVLVDEGPPEARVARQLRRLGVRSLSLLVLTHPQRDHIGGAEDVLRRLLVRAVLDPRLPYPSPFEAGALREARRRRVPVLLARAGAVYRLGRLRLRVLWPDGPGPAGQDPNDHATVLLAEYGRIRALFTADAESNVTASLVDERIDVLKVAHHGSADHGLDDELRVLRPRVAVISVGKDNDYGHPRASTLAALLAVPGLRLFRTDRDGPVVVETDGERLSVR